MNAETAATKTTKAVEDLGGEVKAAAETIKNFGDGFLCDEITAAVSAEFDRSTTTLLDKVLDAQPQAMPPATARAGAQAESQPSATPRSSGRKGKAKGPDKAPPPEPARPPRQPPPGKGKGKAPTTLLAKLFAELNSNDLRAWQMKLKVS